MCVVSVVVCYVVYIESWLLSIEVIFVNVATTGHHARHHLKLVRVRHHALSTGTSKSLHICLL